MVRQQRTVTFQPLAIFRSSGYVVWTKAIVSAKSLLQISLLDDRVFLLSLFLKLGF